MTSPHEFTPWQKPAFAYAQQHERPALFMEQRLGKCIVTIRWVKHFGFRRTLLVAPLSTIQGQLNWQGELQREGIDPSLLSTAPKDRRMQMIRPARIVRSMLTRSWAPGWFAINYDALRTQPEVLQAKWDAIILDESTRIRSPQAQITKVLLKHTSHIAGRAILSGLPNPEDLMDYFCQFVFLDGHMLDMDNYWAFRHRFFHTVFTEWDWKPKAQTRQIIKSYVHNRAFVLTRKDAKVGSAKLREQRSIPLNAAQRKLLMEVKRDFAIGQTETKWAPVVETWMQRIAGGFHPVTLALINDGKVRLVDELIHEDFRHQPLVIWFRFNEELKTVYQWLRTKRRKLTVEMVTGETKRDQRPVIQERFQRGTTHILLMQIKVGRYGWNLAKSSVAVYYSNTYEYEDRAQSEDRIIHLSKTAPCTYLDLVTLGTPDEDVVEALSTKRMNARQFNSRLREQMVARVRRLARGEQVA